MKKKFTLILGICVFILGVITGCAMTETNTYSHKDICLDDWSTNIDKDKEYSEFIEKTLASTIKEDCHLSDCKMKVSCSNGKITSAHVYIVTREDKSDDLETDILNYVSEALEISTQKVTLSVK